jgi:pilus assembly protein Flp/PilA
MYRFFEKAYRFLQEEDGPTAVEYAVMLALIVVVCITAITALGSNASQTFSNTSLNIAAGNKTGGS